MRVLGAALAILLAALPARADEEYEAKRAQDYLKAGQKRLADGKYKEALNAFKRGAEHKPLPEFHYGLAQCQRMLGDPAAAKGEYEAYLKERPDARERAEVESYIAAGGGAPDRDRPAPTESAARQPAEAPSAQVEERCTGGKLKSMDGSGHCCWPNQMWFEERKSCVGSPRCPTGFAVRGLDCVRSGSAPQVRCAAGKVSTRGHCCWPEQVWGDDAEACLGEPRCPEGMRVRARQCVIAPAAD